MCHRATCTAPPSAVIPRSAAGRLVIWFPSSHNAVNAVSPPSSSGQGPTLVHFSAQLRRIVWDRGSMKGLSRDCLGGLREYYGVCRMCFVSDTAQVELKSGRV